jgi:hypothetical protein
MNPTPAPDSIEERFYWRCLAQRMKNMLESKRVRPFIGMEGEELISEFRERFVNHVDGVEEAKERGQVISSGRTHRFLSRLIISLVLVCFFLGVGKLVEFFTNALNHLHLIK